MTIPFQPMKHTQCLSALSIALLLELSLNDAHADGGIVRLREARGPFLVTIFTASEPLQRQTTDVSVMVQRRDSSELVLDATVDLTFTPPRDAVVGPEEQMLCRSCQTPLDRTAAAHTTSFTVVATRNQASNKLLFAVPVRFGASGDWRLQTAVVSAGDTVKLACNIPVGSPPGRLSTLVPYLLLSPVLIGVFAVNQYLRECKINNPGEHRQPTPRILL